MPQLPPPPMGGPACGGGLVDYCMLYYDCGSSACKKQGGDVLIFVLQEATILSDCSNRVIVNKTQKHRSMLKNIYSS